MHIQVAYIYYPRTRVGKLCLDDTWTIRERCPSRAEVGNVYGRAKDTWNLVCHYAWDVQRGWNWLSLSVMAMTVSHDHSFALTTSADHSIVRYNLTVCSSPFLLCHCMTCMVQDASPGGEGPSEKDIGQTSKGQGHPRFSKHKTKQLGSSAIALRGDDRVCAVGGWDGKWVFILLLRASIVDFHGVLRIRLYSTKSFKPLGTLAYHSKNCLTVAFANSSSTSLRIASYEEDDEMTEEEKEARSRWLAAGSQDHRLSIWELKDFGKDSARTNERQTFS